MASLIVGNTLSDLAAASAAAADRRDRRFMDGLDRMENRRRFYELSARDQEETRRLNNQLAVAQAEVDMKRDVGLAPWDRGMTAYQAESMRRAADEIAARERMENAGLAARKEIAGIQARTEDNRTLTMRDNELLKYLHVTPDAQLRYDLGVAELDAKRPVLNAEAERLKRPAGLGIDPDVLFRAGMDQRKQIQSAQMVADHANSLLSEELARGQAQVVNELSGGWLPKFTRDEATIIAGQLSRGEPVVVGGRDLSGDGSVAKAAALLRNQLIPSAVERVRAAIGEGAFATQLNPTLGRFEVAPALRGEAMPPLRVPGGNLVEPPAVAMGAPGGPPAPQLPPTGTASRGPGGRIVVNLPDLRASAAPQPAAANALVAPMVPAELPPVDAEYGPSAGDYRRHLARQVWEENANTRGGLRNRLLEVVADEAGVQPSSGWDYIGSSNIKRQINLTPAQRVAADQKRYDAWFDALPESEKIRILNRVLTR